MSSPQPVLPPEIRPMARIKAIIKKQGGLKNFILMQEILKNPYR